MTEPVAVRRVLLLPDGHPGWTRLPPALAALGEPLTVTAATPTAVLAGQVPHSPALVLTGAAQPDTLAALRRLGRQHPPPAIGVFVPHFELPWYLASGELGAIAYLLWQDLPAAALPDVLRLLLTGATVLFSRSVRDLLERWERDTARQLARPPAAPLSSRELRVAQLLIGGLSHEQIAARLNWSTRTVQRAVAGLRAKHGAPNDICLGARLTGNGCPCPVLVRQASPDPRPGAAP